jgi:CBS domain containing-hemolysin-like protein
MKQKKVHLALVVSEYGKLLGLVTMDDLLALLFGDIHDERDGLQRAGRRGRGGRTPLPGTLPAIDQSSQQVKLEPEALEDGDRDRDRDQDGDGDGDRRPRPRPRPRPGWRRGRRRCARRGGARVIPLSTVISIGTVAVMVHALLVATEIALASCDRAHLRQRAGAGGLSARAAERLAARAETTAATVLVGANLASLTLAVTCALWLVERGHGWYWAAGLAAPPMLVLGQLVPRAIATAHADRLAPLLSLLMIPVGYLLRPLVVVVAAVAAAVTRVIGTDKKKAFITRDELALLIESDPVTDKPGSAPPSAR